MPGKLSELSCSRFLVSPTYLPKIIQIGEGWRSNILDAAQSSISGINATFQTNPIQTSGRREPLFGEHTIN